MGPKFTLLTAILMTLAALTWLFSASALSHAGQELSTRWIVAALFTVLAGIYWALYFRRKQNTPPSGTE